MGESLSVSSDSRRENPSLCAKMAEGRDFPDSINRTQTVPGDRKNRRTGTRLGDLIPSPLICSPPTRTLLHVLCFNEQEQEDSGDTEACEGHRAELLTSS
ncbi:hypothetical protein Q8A67_021637 [Cirrhinus molitorella]|uniref:Uncharacterized protein n=1 Tax=Cirrhinus molitorella TaxID=172907 RepID=A0AA88P3Y9_9TELE|nr:hypothetical protein Q8A67_021637 [Cirrhinus molitorella]